MKIKIIGDRQPFVDGKKAMEGEEFDVSDAAGKDMISSGLAIRADDTPKRARNAFSSTSTILSKPIFSHHDGMLRSTPLNFQNWLPNFRWIPNCPTLWKCCFASS